MNQRYRGIAFLLAFGVLLGKAVQAAPPPAYKLRLIFKQNEASRYQTVAEVVATMPSMRSFIDKGKAPNKRGGDITTEKMETVQNSIQVSILQQMVVNKVLPDGGAMVLASTLSGQVVRDGNQMAPPEKNPMLVHYDTLGNIKAMRATGTTKQTDLMAGLLGSGALGFQRVYLPDKPVQLGDSWVQPVKVPGWNGQGKANAKLIRLEKVGRYQTARISAKVVLPIQIYLNANLQPLTAQKIKKATSALVGTLNMTFETNFALLEGKMIRTGGRGTGTFRIQPLKTSTKAPKTPAPSSDLAFTLEMSIGSSYIE